MTSKIQCASLISSFIHAHCYIGHKGHIKRSCNTSCVYFKLRINLNVHLQYVILRLANRNPSKAAAAM